MNLTTSMSLALSFFLCIAYFAYAISKWRAIFKCSFLLLSFVAVGAAAVFATCVVVP